MNEFLDLAESSVTQQQQQQQRTVVKQKQQVHNQFSVTTSSTALNVDVLQVTNATESRNFTCQAQNSFGLVLFNLTLVVKGKQINIIFLSLSLFYFLYVVLIFWNEWMNANTLIYLVPFCDMFVYFVFV